MYDEGDSTATSDSYHEIRNRWHSAEELRKVGYINMYKDIHYNLT